MHFAILAAMVNSLISLRSSFLQEAQSAPNLFRDLAKVEQYIAESYKTRALIELIQNADDAQAGSFGIHDFLNGFAVGNDGRSFTSDDLEALCRSGASHKHRGGNTIGYRGIGFKSVVNLAKTIYVFSGKYKFFFNKDETHALFNDVTDVPLIRIPHPLEGRDKNFIAAESEILKEKFNYNTVFVFQDLNERISSEEVISFDRGCLLFLHNLKTIEFDYRGTSRKITKETTTDGQKRTSVKILEKDVCDEWEVLLSPRDPKNVIALKSSQGTIIPAHPEESVFHSFTPTTEFAGAFLKINGDYSTDPSRKNLDMDEHSLSSLEDAVSLLAKTIVDLLGGNLHKQGFFSPLVNVGQRISSRTKPNLLLSLTKRLHKMTIQYSDGRTVKFSALRLRPGWLMYQDYEKLCHGDISCVSKDLLVNYPEIADFLAQADVPTLSIQEVINKVNECALSPLGYAQLFTKIVKQFRYSLDLQKVQEIKRLKLFPVAEHIVSAADVKSTSELNEEFLQFVVDNNDAPDLKLFWGKIEIALSTDVQDAIMPRPAVSQSSPSSTDKPSFPLQQGLKSEPNLKQWRSAEQNALEYIKSLNGVSSVTDMSKANLGYDLEVVLDNNKRLYVEVKSVNSFSEPFRLTNNEYSSAHHYGDDYLVAVVINGTPFQMMIIRNPVERVELHKQCERWSWYCDNYKSQLSATSEISESAK